MARGIKIWNSIFIFAIFCSVLFLGCENKERAVGLYVDAMMLVEMDEREKAIEKLIAAIELDPEFAMAYSLKGDLHQEGKEYKESADAYEAATKLDPWSFKDFFNLGKVSAILKEWARAVAAYVRACELEPEHLESHVGAGRCFYELEQYEQALEYTNVAKVLDPNSSDPEILLGDIHRMQGENEDAISAYRRALELEGNEPGIMVPLASAYLSGQRYSAAEELLKSVIEIDPENGKAYEYLGFTHLKLREADLAIADYQKALEYGAAEDAWRAHKGIGIAYLVKAIRSNGDKTLKVVDSDEVKGWKEKGLAGCRKSLELKPEQPKLERLIAGYSG